MVVLPDEDRSVFDDLLADAKVQFQPRNFFESQLVEEVVELTWQINRLRYLVTAHVNAAMIDRRRKIAGPTRIDQDKLAGETGGSTPNGAITVLERRSNRFIQQRSKIMADLDRLKKTPIPLGPTREPKKTKDIEPGWDFQLHDSPPPGYKFAVQEPAEPVDEPVDEPDQAANDEADAEKTPERDANG